MKALLALLAAGSCLAGTPAGNWTIYITNDTCPDYTWGLTEEQTRTSFAELIRAHLDEMRRTDGEAPENRDRYNATATIEALCFLERYPDRKQELVRRIQQRRLFVSPFLNNSLWAFQSVESAIRTLYPARRLEREYGIAIDVAEHIELPGLPWGAASILAGCGIRWLSVPFYDYDSTFKDLSNPPLFALEGPDGASIRVVMDSWASGKASYAQGAHLLRKPDVIAREWLPHYERLGGRYPLRAILASGTHSDISPKSADQARGFADAIIEYNRRAGEHPKLFNATLTEFCQRADEAERRSPFLETLRGCFGHSWDLWPVSLARYAADMRAGERALLAAEALVSVAAMTQPEVIASTRAGRERAEWNWTMLADHAWNGTDRANQQVNAALRRTWSEELLRLGQSLQAKAWAALGLSRAARSVIVFNPLSVPRAGLIRIESPEAATAVGRAPSQLVEEDGRPVLYAISDKIPGFALRQLELATAAGTAEPGPLRATASELESPYYRLRIDPATGGMASLVHKASGAELVAGAHGHTLGQTVYYDGSEHALSGVHTEVTALGPVLARLKVSGGNAGGVVEAFVTVYAALDQVDFDYRVHKPPASREERLTHVFPVLSPGMVERIETTGAVLRPRLQPEGDLLPGADERRFAVQGFVDVSRPGGPGVTIAPLDAFALRRDLGGITFEALGNDQNYKEVTRDQHGIAEFRFRYALRAHAGDYNGPEAFAWSRGVGLPLLAVAGRLDIARTRVLPVEVDSNRAIATAFKPAEEEGALLRLWEVAGQSGSLHLSVRGYRRVVRTDLLERDLQELRIVNGRVAVPLRPHGFATVRLVR